MDKVETYCDKEKYACTTGEVIKHYAVLLQIASKIFIYTSSHAFTLISIHPKMTSPKAAHYLVSVMIYLITF